jgi:hypothetical protein
VCVCTCVRVCVALLSCVQSADAIFCSHLWPVWLHHLVPHYLINGTVFRKQLLNIGCVVSFYKQLLSEAFSF